MRGNQKEDIYRELTPAGLVLCLVIGAIAEIVILGGFGIRLGTELMPVVLFLWCVLGILAAGGLILADMGSCWMKEMRESRRRRLLRIQNRQKMDRMLPAMGSAWDEALEKAA